jgi:1-deoxy-D-xylulose-5-phosphate reductoisomerase
VVSRHPSRFHVFALTANGSADRLLELCRAHRPAVAVLSGTTPSTALEREFAACGSELQFGPAALERVVADPRCGADDARHDGVAGLASTLAAARAAKRVLLANKEALVMAGALVMRAAKESGALVLPVDSEHNAVFQCLSERKAVRKIVLTASGGPFRTAPVESLARVTPEQACAHPNWVMGRKISVDSASMMNKGLEVIEARWLFDAAPESIEVVIHPQSIVHSMVEYADGSVIAQLSNPDMRVPIAHALAWPERIDSGAKPLDLPSLGTLSFEKPDLGRFPCLGLAYDALRAGGSAPAVLNAANEVAVEAFLAGRLAFTGIADVIHGTLSATPVSQAADLGAVLAADRQARATASALVMAKAA